MGIKQTIADRREEILRIAAAHGAHNVRIFGSVAQHRARADSDIDILLELEPGRSLLDQVELAVELEDLLGRRVDVVEPEGLHWFIRDRVLKEAVPL